MRALARIAVVITAVSAGGLAACDRLQNAIQATSIAKTAPEPLTPVAIPAMTMKGGRGDADTTYPADFVATVKSDGTILFPQQDRKSVV